MNLISQNKGKESENSYQKLKRLQGTGTWKHTITKSKYFDEHSSLSQWEEGECMWTHDKDGVTRVFERCHQGVARGMDGGKFKRRLSEVNARAVSRGQNELVCKSQIKGKESENSYQRLKRSL